MASIQRSSFQKNKKDFKKNFIKGTQSSLHNSQLLVSSGIPSLDGQIGGGIPVGSLVLINEDECGAYTQYILKYFLAEGIVSHHALYVCSEDLNVEEMIKELPSAVDAEVEDKRENEPSGQQMTIAWRYENLKVSFAPSGQKHFGHYFDLSKTIDESLISKSNITYWSKKKETFGESFQESAYWLLLQAIKGTIENGQYFAKQNNSERNILRIVLHHLGSPLWEYDCHDAFSKNFIYLITFLYYLRALIRGAYATCIVTLPPSRYKKEHIEKCIHLSDIAIQLQSFTGTKYENVLPYKDYHGFFILQKLAAINSLIAKNPQTTNLAFKLRRKKFVIEEFCLPPELEDTTEREGSDAAVLTCSSSASSKFDF